MAAIEHSHLHVLTLTHRQYRILATALDEMNNKEKWLPEVVAEVRELFEQNFQGSLMIYGERL